MKTKSLLVIIALLTVFSVQGQNKSLRIENCSTPLEIVEGTSFIFPDSLTLEKNNLCIKKTDNGYILQDAKNGGNPTSMTQKTIKNDQFNCQNITIIDGDLTVMSDDENNTLLMVNGSMIVNGDTISQNGIIQTVKIIVPAGIDMYVSTKSDIDITTPINTLQFTCSGASDVTIKKVTKIDFLNISGASNVTIQNCESISIINISGVADITIKACPLITMLNISGVSNIRIPSTTKVESETTSGAGEIKRF